MQEEIDYKKLYLSKSIAHSDCGYCRTGCVIEWKSDDDLKYPTTSYGINMLKLILSLPLPEQDVKKIPDREITIEVSGVPTTVVIKDYLDLVRKIYKDFDMKDVDEWIASVGKKGKYMGEFYGIPEISEPIKQPWHSYRGGNLGFPSGVQHKGLHKFDYPSPRVLFGLFLRYPSISFGEPSPPHGHGN